MKMKSVCFTGHRNVKETAELKKSLLEQLVKLIDEGADVFYAGGAVGWDMLCESSVIELRERFPHIKLHLFLPCPAEEQTASGMRVIKGNLWSYYQRYGRGVLGALL